MTEPRVYRAALPGGFAETAVSRKAGGCSEWALVRHPDGTRFVASLAWLNATFCRPLTAPEWQQLTLAARYFGRRGQTLVVVPPDEALDYDHRLSAIVLPKPVPWFVPR